ncbi:hypothetical protein JVU11DRAFT_2233 [Chiua virens]|nr:hypothetical protein JVU11DRAFT_2233 [Chiua virens]
MLSWFLIATSNLTLLTTQKRFSQPLPIALPKELQHSHNRLFVVKSHDDSPVSTQHMDLEDTPSIATSVCPGRICYNDRSFTPEHKFMTCGILVSQHIVNEVAHTELFKGTVIIQSDSDE